MEPCQTEKEKSAPVIFSLVVVAPTYNNSHTLLGVLDRIKVLNIPLVVVNDGSSDNTASLLAQWLANNPGQPVRIVTHESNQGKAAAMMTGFHTASQWGHTHAATMDTDGQLDPEQLPQMLEIARQSPHALILGYRDDTAADYPAKSRIGRRLSNTAIRLECGQRIRDSQCGLRVYPLNLVLGVPCRAGRFGYETEIITRAVWAGWSIVEFAANCRYLPGEQRITHFKVGRDTARHLGLHARMLALAMWPWSRRSTCLDTTDGTPPVRLSYWRSFLKWINPKELFQMARSQPEERTILALAVALGVFISNLPSYGTHTLLSLFLSRRWHLHPLAVVFGSHFSTPPIGPALVVADVELGHFLLTGKLLHAGDFTLSTTGVMTLVGRTLGELILGSLLLGTILAIAAFFVIRWVFYLMSLRKPREAGSK
jgi:uncharacterized protein (DUF2062 family)